jgi:hypothetical protein
MSWVLVRASSLLRRALVPVKPATAVLSAAVAVARLAMALIVSSWYPGMSWVLNPAARGLVSNVAVLLIDYREVEFELWPSFVRSSSPFPDFAVIRKYSRAKHELKCNAENLLGGVRSLTGGCKVNGILDLLVKYFDGLVDIARLFHGDIIFVEIGRGDFGVVRVEVVQKFHGCASSEANVW